MYCQPDLWQKVPFVFFFILSSFQDDLSQKEKRPFKKRKHGRPHMSAARPSTRLELGENDACTLAAGRVFFTLQMDSEVKQVCMPFHLYSGSHGMI